MNMYLVTAPLSPTNFLTLADLKTHLRVDHTDDDDYITALLSAAVAMIDGRDGWLGRALLSQTWDLKLRAFPYRRIEIPLAPLLEVVSVTYYDEDDTSNVLATTVYDVYGVGGVGGIELKQYQDWPASVRDKAEAIVIRFRAGFVDTDESPDSGSVPEAIVQAIKLIVGSFYENREDLVVGTIAGKLPRAAEALLLPYRLYWMA